MAKHIHLTLTIVAMSTLTAMAQKEVMLHNSGTLTLPKGTTLFVKGSVVNTCDRNINIINCGELHLTGDLINKAGVLFKASSSGVDSFDEAILNSDSVVPASHKVTAGEVHFVGCDTQYIVQETPSKTILFKDIIHKNHLAIQGKGINMVGGIFFNGTHHIFNGGNDICLFEKDNIDDVMCWGYLNGECNSSRIYGSGKLRAITNDTSLWWQLDSLGLNGIPNNLYAMQVVRGDSSIADVADSSLARYYDLTPTFSADSVNLTIKYLPSHYTGRNLSLSDFALFSVNHSDTSSTKQYKPIASTVDLAKRTVTGQDVTIPSGQTTRLTIASTRCSNPPLVVLGSDVDVCFGQPVTLAATLTNYDNDARGAYTYRWSNNEINSMLRLDTLKANKSYTYSVMVQDRFGCKGWDTITVRCHPVPSMDSMIVGRMNVMCQNQQVELYAKASDCALYSWSIASTDAGKPFEKAIDSLWGAQRLKENFAPGAYSVNVKCTSGMGCTLSQTKRITIEQLPDVRLCYERKNELMYELRNESNAYADFRSTQWIINGKAVAETSSPYLHTFPDTGSYSVKLVTGGQVCRDSLTQPLHVMSYGMPAFTTPQSIYCTGEVVRYTNTSHITESGVQYSWRFGNGDISDMANPEKTYSQAGTYTDTLVVTFLANGTEKKVTRTIVINPTPHAGFNADSVHTCGTYYTLVAQDNAAGYRWSNGSATPSIDATQNGRYSVTLTSAQGCTSTESVYVTLNSKMKINLGANRTACGSVLLDAQNPGNTSYLWSNGSTGRTLEATQSGTYSVHVSHSNGCTDSARVSLTINSKPDASLGKRNILLCENSSITLAPAFSSSNTYLWSNGSATPSMKIEQAGMYSVSVSNGTCSSADTVWVCTQPAEPISLGKDRFLCNAEPTMFTLPSYLSISSVAWYKDAEPVSTQFSYLTHEAGVYSVQATYPNGCKVTDTVQVEHSAAGVYVDFLVASVAEVGDSLHLIDLSYPDVTHRTWTFSDGFSSNEKYVYHAFYLPGDKIVTLTAGNGQCTSERSKRISVVDKIIINDEDGDSTQIIAPENPLQPEQKTAKYVEIEEVKVYPNPSNGEFYVAVRLNSTTDLVVELYNVNGALIKQRPIRRAKEHTELFNVGRQPGLYMLQVKAGSERKTVKILVNNE